MIGLESKIAMQHIVERPKHLNLISRTKRGKDYIKIIETLKMIDRTKALCYDKIELEREFTKLANFKCYLSVVAKKVGLTKIRVVEDEGKVYIWSNGERS